jgi:hypothetical protein
MRDFCLLGIEYIFIGLPVAPLVSENNHFMSAKYACRDFILTQLCVINDGKTRINKK